MIFRIRAQKSHWKDKCSCSLNIIFGQRNIQTISLWLYTVGVHSTSIDFTLLFPLLPHLQFWFHLSAAKCVYSNTWQAHWTCTGSLCELQRVTDGQHTTPVRLLMFNSDCNLFPSQSSGCSAQVPRLQHPWELERAVVLSWGPLCPSPSTSASVEHSIYLIAPLDLIALTSQIPQRVMRWLRWCQSQCWLGGPTTRWGSLKKKKIKKKRRKCGVERKGDSIR